MKSSLDVGEITDLIINIAPSFSEVLKVILFGSYARGEANIQSDVDVAIVHENDIVSSFSRALKSKFNKVYDGDIDVQFTYLSQINYEEDNHILNVAKSVREEGITLWSR